VFVSAACFQDAEISHDEWVNCLHLKSAKVGDTDLVIEDLMNGECVEEAGEAGRVGVRCDTAWYL